jgi:hypothetical protein
VRLSLSCRSSSCPALPSRRSAAFKVHGGRRPVRRGHYTSGRPAFPGGKDRAGGRQGHGSDGGRWRRGTEGAGQPGEARACIAGRGRWLPPEGEWAEVYIAGGAPCLHRPRAEPVGPLGIRGRQGAGDRVYSGQCCAHRLPDYEVLWAVLGEVRRRHPEP